ncbi:hypothetical protein BLOT_013276 [Blomia tropicalis]|nr:hypothetical protein BLOT_013276 [Blomia tropicalis]
MVTLSIFMYAAILLVLKFLFALMYCVCDRYFVRKRRNRKRLQSIGSWRRLEESTTTFYYLLLSKLH